MSSTTSSQSKPKGKRTVKKPTEAQLAHYARMRQAAEAKRADPSVQSQERASWRDLPLPALRIIVSIASHLKGIPLFRMPHTQEFDGTSMWQGYFPDESMPHSFRLSLSEGYQAAEEGRFETQRLAGAIGNTLQQIRVCEENHAVQRDPNVLADLEEKIYQHRARLANMEHQMELHRDAIEREKLTWWTFDVREF